MIRSRVRSGMAKDFPSRYNTGDRFQTEEKIAANFVAEHVNSDIEHAITVDERGYVTQYVHGDATSVGISGRKGEMVYHNHPGAHGGAFSDSDLLVTATDQSRGIVAVAREGTYTFTKGRKFDAAGFYAAVKKAKVPAELDYDAGVAHWMKKNAKKYDFTYTFTQWEAADMAGGGSSNVVYATLDPESGQLSMTLEEVLALLDAGKRVAFVYLGKEFEAGEIDTTKGYMIFNAFLAERGAPLLWQLEFDLDGALLSSAMYMLTATQVE